MFENKISPVVEKYLEAVAFKEKAELIKKGVFSDLLIQEDGSGDITKLRKALAIAKDDLDIADNRVQKRLENLKGVITKNTDKHLKALDKKIAEFSNLFSEQQYEAGRCVGQALTYFRSLGPGHQEFAKMMENVGEAFKCVQDANTAGLIRGYSEGASIEVKNVHVLKNELDTLKRVRDNPSNRKHYEYKKLHGLLRNHR